MKTFLIAVLALLLTASYIQASSVTAIDKDNVIVTNDLGTNSQYSLAELNQTVSGSNKKVVADQRALLIDQETALTWAGVQAMAFNAVSTFNNSEEP